MVCDAAPDVKAPGVQTTNENWLPVVTGSALVLCQDVVGRILD